MASVNTVLHFMEITFPDETAHKSASLGLSFPVMIDCESEYAEITLEALRDKLRASSALERDLMKLRRLAPGEYRYAVAVREGAGIWLTLWVRRSPKGEYFVMVPQGTEG